MNNQHMRKGLSPLAAGMTGLVIGAIGTAVGIAMSNEDNRKKVHKKAKTVSDWGNQKVQDIRTTARKTLDKTEKSVEDIKRDSKSGNGNGRTTQGTTNK